MKTILVNKKESTISFDGEVSFQLTDEELMKFKELFDLQALIKNKSFEVLNLTENNSDWTTFDSSIDDNILKVVIKQGMEG